jgi:hypothetical protein
MEGRLIDRITQKYLVNKIQDDDSEVFSDEAIEHIKFYIAPYLDELDKVTDNNFALITERYPEDVKDQIDRMERRNGLPSNKYSIMDTLIGGIIFGDNDEVFNNNSNVDPWDVEIQFRSSTKPRQLFHLQPLTEQEKHCEVPINIDVDINIGDGKFTHKMSREMIKGIIAYYNAFELQHPISIYGKTFVNETDEIMPLDRHVSNEYTVKINGMAYGICDGPIINVQEFMKGVVTAHQWVFGDEPHEHISDLKFHGKMSTGSNRNNTLLTF